MEDFKTVPHSKDPYDIDILAAKIEIIRLLKNSKGTIHIDDQDKYLERINNLIHDYCRYENIAYNQLIGSELLVVSQNSGFYELAIEIDLVSRPIYILELYLNYHLKKYRRGTKDDKIRFVHLISERVCKRIDKFSPFNEVEKLDKIIQWVKAQFQELGDFPEPVSIKIKRKHQEPLFQDLKKYFNEKQWDRLNNLLAGIPSDYPIVFLGQVNKLIDVFYRLHEESLLDNHKTVTARWISQYFYYYDRKSDEFGVKKPKSIAYSICYEAMKKKCSERRPNNDKKIPISFMKSVDMIER